MPRRFLSFFSRSLLGRLTLLVGAVFVPAAVLAAWLIYQGYANERAALERHLSGAARATALLVDSALLERQALLDGLSTSQRLASGDLAGFRQQMLSAVRRPGEWFVLMDVDGQHLINTLVPMSGPLPQTRFGREFDAAVESGRDYVSNLITGPVTRDHVLFTTIPIRPDGKLRYTLSFAMTPASFKELLSGGGAGRSWTVAVIDRAGRIAARNRSPEKYVGGNATAPLLNALAARGEGLIETTTLDGIRSITAFTRAPHTGWAIVMAAPADELFGPAERLLALGLGLAVLLGFLAALQASWIGRGVVSAVRTLVAGTEAIGRGERPSTGPTGIAEIDLVQHALAESSARLAAREAQLQQLNESLRSSHAQALAASQAKDDFLAALSHELRTPLSPVLLTAGDAARNPEFPPAAREAFSAIERNVQLEARLIDDLLDLTRVAEGKVLFHPQPTDLHAVLRDALATVRPEAEAKHQHVELDLAATVTTLTGDPTRLQQVFWNVLKNAVKFTPDGGRIAVTTRNVDRTISIEVTDSGIGMTREEIERSFRNFSQGDHAKPGTGHRFGGLGLGLAISRALVELHHGRISVRSAGRGQGATFSVELPLPATPAGVVAAPPPAVEPSEEGRRETSLRILVVDDHEPTRTALQRLLERRGHFIAVAGNVSEALRVASDARIDLVISDIGLPDGDGYGLMRQLQREHGLKGIALTGYGMSEDIARAESAGFVAHLTKPVDVRRLESTLARVVADHFVGERTG